MKGAKTFGREWLRSPLRVGAITPSSARLANAITVGISDETGPVIELGPGTGAITRSILARGVSAHDLAAIELGPSFANALREKHPDIHVIEGDACHVADLSPFGREGAADVICGLPLVSLPKDTVERILVGSFEALQPGGAFRLFTYAHRCPIGASTLMRLGLRSRKVSRTLRNLPPASVYELKRTI
ncbi:MAG: methyltransferase domain-containing protein [Erythrobacter sp.]|nr:methyltransferase domain-containing protein [Erythrobacter sp.]